jgi:hypothetical protein
MALEPVHDVKHWRDRRARLGVNATPDGFPQGVAVVLGLLAAICLAFFVVAVFGGFP